MALIPASHNVPPAISETTPLVTLVHQPAPNVSLPQHIASPVTLPTFSIYRQCLAYPPVQTEPTFQGQFA